MLWFFGIMVNNFGMNYFLSSLVGLFVFSTPFISLAYLPTIMQPQQPYEALTIDADIETAHNYLGELKGDPHLFEFTLKEPKKLSLVISQREINKERAPFSLILVRNNGSGRGVTEIGRVKNEEMDWQTNYNQNLSFELTNSKTISYELEPGVYRFEISSPLNQGRYLLLVGQINDESSYSEKIKSIIMIQDFFGLSNWRVILSTTVLYPGGSILILLLFWLTWRYQHKKQKNA